MSAKSDKFATISAPVEGTFEDNRGQVHPTISIPLASGKPFSFGIDKAHAIVKHLEAIKTFAAKHPAKGVDLAKAVKSMTPEQRATLAALLAETE